MRGVLAGPSCQYKDLQHRDSLGKMAAAETSSAFGTPKLDQLLSARGQRTRSLMSPYNA